MAEDWIDDFLADYDPVPGLVARGVVSNEPPAPAEKEHVPEAVEGVVGLDGFVFIRCSCDEPSTPIANIWLTDHWQGSRADGVAAILAVVTRQAAGAEARP